jgi:hypothetical protein
MQIVNGYICMNCCDIDKARLGQDPHQQANQIQKQLKDLFDSPAQAKGSSDSAASASPSGKPPAASGPATSSRVDLRA